MHRSRLEIEGEMLAVIQGCPDAPSVAVDLAQMQLEVLLDIRDLLISAAEAKASAV